MTLREAIDRYIVWRRSHGAKFRSTGDILLIFVKRFQAETLCDEVTVEDVRAFLASDGRLTRYRENKYSALAGLYRFALARGYASGWPLPDNEPKAPESAPPYVYTHDEIRRLFAAVDARTRGFQLDPATLRTLLLILYGAGLRLGEALRLTLDDVDLSAGVLNVRDTKFYKGRLVPVGQQLAGALKTYATDRTKTFASRDRRSTFLANRDGTRVNEGTVRNAFRLVRQHAGVPVDARRQTPGLHSFRHSFAVHRLTSWYRQGSDVQRLLPALSTYLGHKNLTGTQVYLTMTPELLEQASLRFQRYAQGGDDA